MSDFEYDLYKWALEGKLESSFYFTLNLASLNSSTPTVISLVTMDARLDSLRPDLPADSDARKLIRASHEVIEALHHTEIGTTDAWRFYPTRMYKQLCVNEDKMAQIVSKYIKKVQADGKDTAAHQLFRNSNNSFGDVLGTVLDLLLAGIDTTAFSAGFLIYYFAKNPECQEKARAEVNSVLPGDAPVTADALQELPYLRACLKVTLDIKCTLQFN